MVKINIPKQEVGPQGMHVESRERKSDGKPYSMTHFLVANAEGIILGAAVAYGDRLTQIKEAMASGQPIECESCEPGKYADGQPTGKFEVKFPKGSGGEANYRGQFGGKKEWVPGGYRGKPVSQDRWTEITDMILTHYYTTHMKLLGGDAAQQGPALAAARELTAQYWISVERNLTFPPGCEPAVAATTTATAGATTQTGTAPAATGNGKQHAPTGDAAYDAFMARIRAMGNPVERRSFEDEIKASSFTPTQKQDAFLAVFERSKELTG